MATNGLPALTPENLNNQNNYKLISEDAKSKSMKSYPVNTEVSCFIHCWNDNYCFTFRLF